MKNTLKFGANAPVIIDRKKGTSLQQKGKRFADVVADGPETNGFTRYDHDISFANIRPNVNVTRVKDDDATDYGVVKGSILAGVPLTIPKNDSGATLHAMKKRCDYSPSAPDMSVFKVGHDKVMSLFDAFPTIQPDRESIMDYVSGYTPSKAQRLLAVLEEQQLNWSGESKHVFAKQEVLLKEHGAQPRVVYQGTDMYNLIAGCVVVELAKRMKQVFSLSNPKNTGNRVIFAAGLKNEEIGDILESSPGVMVENDMKNNDGSQSVEFRRFEAMLYAKLGAPMWFVKEFARNTSVRVWTRYGVSAHVEGQMWSGVQNTTTGNSYVGMCCILAALQQAGIQESTNVHGGDDYLGVIPQGQEDKFVAALKVAVPAVGMTPEPVIPESREHATFYRKRYVRGRNGTRGVPQFGRVLAKLNVRSNMNSGVNDRDYMAGKYLSAAYEHRYAPGLSNILLEASAAMSDKPHVDAQTNREVGHKGAEFLREKIEVEPIDYDSFNGFLNDVYGINHDQLCDLYGRVAESCVMWLNKWVTVDKRGKAHSKRGAPVDKLTGEIVDALVRKDVAT
jgi:hypothetical protein